MAAEADYTDVSLTAAERVRALGKMGNSVEINEDIHPRRYFRSGVEMERMADVYLAEGSLENAYVLYTKFIMWDLTTHPKHHVQASSEAVTVAKVTATLEGHFYIKKRPQ